MSWRGAPVRTARRRPRGADALPRAPDHAGRAQRDARLASLLALGLHGAAPGRVIDVPSGDRGALHVSAQRADLLLHARGRARVPPTETAFAARRPLGLRAIGQWTVAPVAGHSPGSASLRASASAQSPLRPDEPVPHQRKHRPSRIGVGSRLASWCGSSTGERPIASRCRATPTFGVSLQALGEIPFDPATRRASLRFTDMQGDARPDERRRDHPVSEFP